MAKFGRIDEFEVGTSWKRYIQKLTFYFEANGIVDDQKKKNIFLTVCGNATFNIADSLVKPETLETTTFAVLKTKLESHFEPAPNRIVERFKFNKRDQMSGESVAEYVAELRHLSEYCEFTDLDDRLRDRLVCGVKEETLKHKFFEAKDLTFQTAYDMAVAAEMANKNVQDVRQATPVNSLKSRQTLKSDKPTRGRVKQPDSANTSQIQEKPCYRCGKSTHLPSKCFAINAKCNLCHKVGHYAKVCKAKQYRKSKPTHKIESTDDNNSTQDSIVNFYAFQHERPSPITLDISINCKPFKMELDTGSAVSILSEVQFNSLLNEVKLSESDILLKPYLGNPIKPLGKFQGAVSYQGQNNTHTFHVVKGDGPLLLGREFLQIFKVQWKNVHRISVNSIEFLKAMIAEHEDLFKPGIGRLKNKLIKLELVKGATPTFCKPRSVPFSLRTKIEDELSRLENDDIIVKVERSDWGTPIVPVLKKNGEVRICGDYKVTVNPHLKREKYPLPTMDELFAKLANGEKFSKLDVRWAYLHLQLHEESQQVLTISTHKGLFKVKRLPFGITTASEIFQRTIEEVLMSIENVGVMQDDVIVTGKTDEEHLENLRKVLTALKNAGFKLNREKCQFMTDSLEYLGFKISKEGLQPTTDKLDAITQAPQPDSVTKLRAFLGLINFYGKFIPNLATEVHDLYELLQKDQKFVWLKKHEKSFLRVKELLQKSQILVHFDPKVPVELMCDASSYGLGAVLVHRFPDGNVKPVAFASKTLNQAQKNYSQIDKEALAIIFGVQKFHQYLFGLKFILWTDHKPLISIFNPCKGVPGMVAARMQRWSLILATYDYEIKYLTSCQNKMADLLSRYPVAKEMESESQSDVEVRCLYFEKFSILPVTAKTIATQTSHDPILSRVYHSVQHGWTENQTVPEHLKPYFMKRSELTTEQGCILWGMRVVIPNKLRDRILEQLHDSHLGVVKAKSLARQHVWWPGIDSAIEDLIAKCQHCIAVKKNPAHSPLHPWEWPTKPWQRIHIDFAGPFGDTSLLLLVDAHSKWPEVVPMKSTTAKATIKQLKLIFARFGLPERIVSDNGPQFSSQEFKDFARTNGIRHTFSAPYHPATNGAVENFVGTTKKSIKANMNSGLDIEEAIIRFLSSYRSASHATTGVPPCQLMLGRMSRSRLDLLHPRELSAVIRDKQELQVKHRKGVPREIAIGDYVLAKDYRRGKNWQRAIVRSQQGKQTFILENELGMKLKRHIDQMWLSGPDSRDQHEEDSFTKPAEFMDGSVSFPAYTNVPSVCPRSNVVTPVSPATEIPTEVSGTGPALSIENPPPILSFPPTTPKTPRMENNPLPRDMPFSTPGSATPKGLTKTKSGRTVTKPARFRD